MNKADKERELAKEVQERTFPRRIPQVAGFEVYGRTQPADLNDGDFFDAIGVRPREGRHGFVLDDADTVEHLVLAMGDATGHGMSAALMATELRALLRASIRLGVYHRDLTAMVNAQLSEDLADHHFITMLLGRLIRERAMYRWVSFGQGPIWFYRHADRRVTALEPHLPPLGILPELGAYAPTETRFEPGDVFLALSDGFPEAQNAAGDLLGEEALRETLLQHAAAAPAALADALWARVEHHRGSAAISDDRTLLLIRRGRP